MVPTLLWQFICLSPWRNWLISLKSFSFVKWRMIHCVRIFKNLNNAWHMMGSLRRTNYYTALLLTVIKHTVKFFSQLLVESLDLSLYRYAIESSIKWVRVVLKAVWDGEDLLSQCSCLENPARSEEPQCLQSMGFKNPDMIDHLCTIRRGKFLLRHAVAMVYRVTLC